MPALVKLSDMRQRVRELADMETANQASFFVDDLELNRAINAWLRRLHDLLVECRGDDYYAKVVDFPAVPGQSKYALPADFMQLLKVVVSDGSNFRPLPRWQDDQWAVLLSTQTPSYLLYRYRLEDRVVEVLPAPSDSSHTFYLRYIRGSDTLTADDSTFDGVNGWEEWALYNVAVDILNKEESFEQAQALAARASKLEQTIRKLAGNRDAGEPARVQDTRRDWGGRARVDAVLDDRGIWYGKV